MVFVALVAMVLVAMRQGGLLWSETGRFSAIDGDSLRKGDAEYRLHAIDAPELRQLCISAAGAEYACGREAQSELRRLVSSGDIECRGLETDRYGRTVVTCMSGTTDINAEMVRSGWAVAYRSKGLDYVAAEDEAKAARRGIWQGQFDNPEAWRKQQRSRMVQGSMGEELPPD
jgi:endonuclease YncB( thermonuclease family)